MMLTVDSITGGNRERDLRTGFSLPFRLTLAGMAVVRDQAHVGPQLRHPGAFQTSSTRGARRHERRRALDRPVFRGKMLDPSMSWNDAAKMVRRWNCHFCLKGVPSVADAKRAVTIGCTGIVVSNHGGRQLDGSRASFDQLAEIVDAVGDRIDVLMDGGVQRGSHVLKALSVGAKAVGVGRYYLYPLAAAGQRGVERALGLMRGEIERDMKLMGCTAISQLSRDNLRFR